MQSLYNIITVLNNSYCNISISVIQLRPNYCCGTYMMLGNIRLEFVFVFWAVDGNHELLCSKHCIPIGALFINNNVIC